MALADVDLKRIRAARARTSARGRRRRRDPRRLHPDIGDVGFGVPHRLPPEERVAATVRWNPSRPPVIQPKAWRDVRALDLQQTSAAEGRRVRGQAAPAGLIARLATAQANGTLGQRRGPSFVGRSSEFLDDTVVAVDQEGKSWTWLEVKRFMENDIANEAGQLENPFGIGGTDNIVQWDPAMSPAEWYEFGKDREDEFGSWEDIALAHLGAVAPDDPLAAQFLAGAGRGGGGGGGGGADPIYVAPDRDAVREQVKNYVVAVLGTLNEGAIEAGVDAFMAGDREGFDKRESVQVDPWQRVLGVVRAREEYTDLHELRPESVDEMEWVTSSQGKLKSLGINAERAESLGIGLARVGADDEALLQSAEASQFGDSSRLLRTQRQGLKQKASAVAGLL